MKSIVTKLGEYQPKIDMNMFKYSSNPLFSFTYQQILRVANTIVADLDTTFVRLVNRPKK